MKQAVFAAVAAVTLGAGSLAQGQAAWEPIGTRNGAPASYNPATVERKGTVVTAMVKYDGPQSMRENFASAAIPVASYQERMSIDCAAKTYAALQTTGYSSAGTQLYQFGNGASMISTAERPDLATLQAKVCK